MSKNEITTTKGDLKSLINSDAIKAQIARALPQHMTADRLIRVACTTLLRVPKLAECDQTSFMQALLTCSQLGIEPDNRRAYLIPFENRKMNIVECQLIIGFMGLIELAKRSGEVSSWKAETVKERDEFSWENGNISHRVNWREDRGKLQCVYSVVRLANGDIDTEVMTLAEVEAIKSRSRASSSGPWVSDFEEMAKKTVIRRHSKRLTLSPDFHEALEKDGDKLAEIRNVTTRAELSTQTNPFTAPAIESAPAEAEDIAWEVEGKEVEA